MRTPEVCTCGCSRWGKSKSFHLIIQLGITSQGWVRFGIPGEGTVWQHQHWGWPLSLTDVAVLRMRRCLLCRMMLSWPVALSQGQLSTRCRASLASLLSWLQLWWGRREVGKQGNPPSLQCPGSAQPEAVTQELLRAPRWQLWIRHFGAIKEKISSYFPHSSSCRDTIYLH